MIKVKPRSITMLVH